MKKFIATVVLASSALLGPAIIASPDADAATICWREDGKGRCVTTSISCADAGLVNGEVTHDDSGSIYCED